jgi:hypothetical protein
LREKIYLVDIILCHVYNLWIMILFLMCNLVFLNGDTLIFMKNGGVIDQKKLTIHTIRNTQGEKRISLQAKVSPDNRFYLIHETKQEIVIVQDAGHDIRKDTSTSTEISFHNAEMEILYAEKTGDNRYISYELSNIHNSLFVLTTWDEHNNNPAFSIIKDGKKTEIIKEDQWQRIVSYKMSSNNRFLLFHTRNPYHGKPWDYIFFYDRNTGNSWEYIFPTCLSCKKGRIELEIDDNGRSEVIHKKEHRVFSPDGVIQDIYLKLQ